MTKRLTIALVAVALFVLLAVMPVSAAFASAKPVSAAFASAKPVSAAFASANLTVINQSATVFIGEQGLNLTQALNAAQKQGVDTGSAKAIKYGSAPINYTIGWWASAASITTTAPSAKVDTRASYKSFTIDKDLFVGYTGNWYLINSLNHAALKNKEGKPILVFTVVDPRLEVAVWDFSQNKDVTGLSITQGQRLGISVKTNMVLTPSIDRRAPGNGLRGNASNAIVGANGEYLDGYLTIKVKNDQGAVFRALRNKTGTVPLTKQFVNKQPWYWPYNMNAAGTLETGGGYWVTDAVDGNNEYIYPVGTYSIWVESTLNRMKDNYKSGGADYTGKTVSATVTITLVSDTVKIEANKDSVVRSKPFSVTVTGRPNTIYQIWVKNTAAMSGGVDDQPPMIQMYQEGVAFDNMRKTHWAGNIPVENGVNGATIRGDVPSAPYHGILYYANITTPASGVRTVQWITTNFTKAQKYTIRVQTNTTAATPVYKSDEVDVNVEKGAVTIVAAGDQSYYLGEEIKLSGTNTETYTTYLFLIGPNLPVNGAMIQNQDPRSAEGVAGTAGVANNVARSFKSVTVNGDNTWSWKWGTANYALDAGTYTVYAVSQPNDKAHLANAAYGTVSIIIKKPFVSATASQSTVAKGDKVFITGTAEGDPGTVAIWIMGKNYAARNTAAVNSDSSFKYEITRATTTDKTAGQYFVVVQHPMQNKQYDVDIGAARTADASYVINKMLTNSQSLATGNYSRIFKLLGAGSLQGSDAAEALAEGINNANVDDTYTKLQFLIEEPTITIDPIGDKHVGDKFTITAKTNLAVDDEILVQVYSSSFKPTMKSQSGEFSGASGTVKVTKGDSGYNKISFDVDSSTFKPDEYIVTEQAVLITSATGTALFNVLETTVKTVAPTTAATAVQTPAQTAVPTTVATAAPTATPTKSPGFGALVALIGLGAVAFVVVRRH